VAPDFLVTSLIMRPVCLISQGRSEEPVRPRTRLMMTLIVLINLLISCWGKSIKL